MLLDGQILDARNTAEIRRRIGCVAEDDARLSDDRPPRGHTHDMAEVDGLVSALSGLSASLASLASSLSVLTEAVTALATVPDVDVIDLDGVPLVQPRDVGQSGYETLVLDCPDDGAKYRLVRVTADGETTFRPVRANQVEAGDGNNYTLQVRLVDGIPVLDQPELVP